MVANSLHWESQRQKVTTQQPKLFAPENEFNSDEDDDAVLQDEMLMQKNQLFKQQMDMYIDQNKTQVQKLFNIQDNVYTEEFHSMYFD